MMKYRSMNKSIYLRLIAVSLCLHFFGHVVTAQEADFMAADFYIQNGDSIKAATFIKKALDKSVSKYGERSLEYEKDIRKAVSCYYLLSQPEIARTIIDNRLNQWENFGKRLLDDKTISRDQYASMLSGEYQSLGYLCESCSDTLYALTTYRKSVEPFEQLNIHNQQYADALFYSGVLESQWSKDYTRIREMRLYKASVQEYLALSSPSSLMIEKLRYISGCVSAKLGECKLDQVKGKEGASANAYECIGIWKDCLNMFHDALGKNAVDSILVAKSSEQLAEWSKMNSMYEYATKMHIIEPYWDSYNLFATDLALICFKIGDGDLSEATRILDDVINNLGNYGLLNVDFSLYNVNVGFIRTTIDDYGADRATQCLHDWYGRPGDHFSRNSVKIASELIYHTAYRMWQSGFMLEAKDLFERLYLNGSIERDLPDINIYDISCAELFSLSNIHFEYTRTILAKINDRLKTHYWDSPLFKELRSLNVDTYINPYNFINDCIILSHICEYDRHYDDAISFLLKAEASIPKLDPIGVSSRYEDDMRPVLYNQMGMCYGNNHDTSNAIYYYEKSSQLGYLPATINLGSIYYYNGDYKKAIVNLEEGRKFFGVDGTDVLQAAYAAIGENDKANAIGHECLENKREKDLQLLFKMFPTERKSYPFGYPLFSICAQYPKAFGELCYDAVLYSKSMELHYEQTLRNAICSQDSLMKQYQSIWDAVVPNNGYYRNFTTRYREFMDLLQNYIVNNGGITEYYTTWCDVQRNLKKGDIAIEFFQYYDLGDTVNEKYGAVIVKDSGNPIIISLPSSYLFKDFVNKSDAGYKTSSASSPIYEAIFGQIASYMTRGKKVYFSPDGILRQINIECLYTSDDKNAKLACEEYNFVRMSSTRELCLSGHELNSKDAVLYGNLRYDMSKEDMEVEHKMYGRTQYELEESKNILRGSGGKMAKDLTIALANTKIEIDKISSLMSAYNVSATIVEGYKGIEESFKSLSGHAPSILHLATHGFYRSESMAARESFYTSNTDGNLIKARPMDRSGLIFSGAINALSGEFIEGVDDGVLLASEIASMDLSNTNLAVLSACQTGLGDVSNGEVYGLQRGFKLAGVQTIIMSLWNVEDEATAEFMTTFYRSYLSGKNRHESFNKARAYLYKKYPEKANIWAAFIMLD